MAKSRVTPKPATPPPDLDRDRVDPLDLLLDPQNPRLYGTEAEGSPDQDVLLQTVWSFGVDELVESITASGFHNVEPLFAERQKNGKLVVVEGNRRLTALQVLLDPARAKRLGITQVPALSPSVRKSCVLVPVAIGQRDQVWQFIATKHVNGPKTWDSVAKAAYIKHVHEDLGKDLDEITRAIGDRNKTALRMYSAMKVIDQAEAWGVYKREDYYGKGDLPFSHLYTLLGYDTVRTFLDLEPEPKPQAPIPSRSKKKLGELLLWIYGNKRQQIQPRIKKQNPDARNLAEALGEERGIAALRAGYEPSIAAEMSKGDESLLMQYLQISRDNLRLASGRFATGYSKSQHTEVFTEIRELVRAMVAQQSAKETSGI